MRGLLAIICTGALAQIASALHNGTVPVYYSRSMNDSQAVHLYQNRQAKFLPFYSVVRFKNNACNGTNGRIGTCYLKSECRRNQGVAFGKCARLGVCCVVTRNCGGPASSSNNTYFLNPGFPEPYGGGAACTLSIAKNRNSVTHVRLAFTDFALAQPEATGICTVDRMSIQGADSRTPVICGDNTDQHMWLKFLPDNSAMQIIITANSADTFKRRWNILVSQHEQKESPPPGCLMYFTTPGGQIKSFNYNTVAQTPAVVGTREIANMNYMACIRSAAGYCAAEWTQTPGNPFSTSGNPAGIPAVGSLTGDACTSDYVIIPNAVTNTATGASADRFCGASFPTVPTSLTPFMLGVVTNADETGDTSNRGFDLTYRQTLCP